MRLTALKYVSEKREQQFNKLGVYSVEELVRHYPRDYCDLTCQTLLKDAFHNEIVLTPCTVLSIEANRYSKRPFVKALCQQGNYIFSSIWFNQPYVASKLKPGEYLFYGRVQNRLAA